MEVKKHIIAGSKKLQGILLPPICLLCGRKKVAELANFCPQCWRKAKFITKPYCALTGVPFSYEWEEGTISRHAKLFPPAYDCARCALIYESNFARALILKLKYGDSPEIAQSAAIWLARAAKDILPECDFITPVPLHWRRLWHRRFNQAAELARSLAKLTGKNYARDILTRVRATTPQIGLGKKERNRNVRGAFQLTPNWKQTIKNKNVILIDDVMTSGATLESCTKALRRAGAKRVNIVVLARVVHEKEMIV